MDLRTMVECRYSPVRLIGSGGIGRVYLVREKETGVKYALKEVYSGSNNNIAAWRKKLVNEGEILKILNHPNIPKFHKLLEDKERIVLITEYIAGITLWEETVRKGGIDEATLIDVMIKLCSTLEYLHNRSETIVYRDIKPSNIMLRGNGEISLLDFGSAVYRSSDYISEGTGYYASPEHFKGRVDCRSDIYSLGKTALRASKLFGGGLISRDFSMILRKAVEKEPLMRYQNVTGMKNALLYLRNKRNLTELKDALLNLRNKRKV